MINSWKVAQGHLRYEEMIAILKGLVALVAITSIS